MLFDERIPLEIRNLAIARIFKCESLEPKAGEDRQLHTLALLLALEANSELALYEGEKPLLYATGKNFDIGELEISRARFNSRKKSRDSGGARRVR